MILVILFALVFEFINGFHDTANAIATAVYTKALRPHKAIALAALMNLSGALVSEKVAGTISKGLVNIELEQYVILSALIGAILWNLFKKTEIIYIRKHIGMVHHRRSMLVSYRK